MIFLDYFYPNFQLLKSESNILPLFKFIYLEWIRNAQWEEGIYW